MSSPPFHEDIQLTQSFGAVLEEVRRVIGWYNLLYLGEPFEPWKVYWHGLTSSLDGKALESLAERLGMSDAREQRMIGQQGGREQPP